MTMAKIRTRCLKTPEIAEDLLRESLFEGPALAVVDSKLKRDNKKVTNLNGCSSPHYDIPKTLHFILELENGVQIK